MHCIQPLRPGTAEEALTVSPNGPVPYDGRQHNQADVHLAHTQGYQRKPVRQINQQHQKGQSFHPLEDRSYMRRCPAPNTRPQTWQGACHLPPPKQDCR